MGIYAYKAAWKAFDVTVDGINHRARIIHFWMKPYWEIFDWVLSGRLPSYARDWQKEIYWQDYRALERLNKTEPVTAMVLPNVREKRSPSEGDTVLVYPTPRLFVFDDPDWDKAEIRTLHKTSEGWIAEKAEKGAA